MSSDLTDEVMLMGNCKGRADAVVRCQCDIENAPARCPQAKNCMFYTYYKCSRQWRRLA